MIPAVAREFMALIDDAADQRGMTMRHPAKRKECRFNAVSGEHCKASVGIRLNSAVESVPVFGIDYRFKGTDLKPVFDID